MPSNTDIPVTPKNNRVSQLSGVVNPVITTLPPMPSRLRRVEVADLDRELDPSFPPPVTPATRTVVHLEGLSLITPTRAATAPHDPVSPALSIYADTECRSPESPTTRAAYIERHSAPTRRRKEKDGSPCREERQVSPESPTASYGDENFIGVHEWPIYHRGLRSATSEVGVLAPSQGHNSTPGGRKRKLNEASFRHSTPKRSTAKKAKFFPPPEPYNHNANYEEEEEEEDWEES